MFKMSKKYGKSVLLKSVDKKGFHTIRATLEFHEASDNAKLACPVKIISVKLK